VAAQTSNQRSVLAVEMKSVLDDLVSAVDRSEKAGYINESDKRTVLELMERLYRELFVQYKEFTGVDTMLQERILTYSEEAELRGMEKGMEKGKKEVARSMLARGMPLLEVAEIAGLPMDKLQDLAPRS
jgi:predicted transposase/invertase (TIGR01784 family)